MPETAEGRTTRESILEAASQVVLTEGVSSLTLDEVARMAGISKGGLLYHFRSKSALIAGMLNNLVEQFEGALEQELRNEGEHPAPGAWHRAYVRATFYHEQLPSVVTSGLLAAVATEPELLEAIRAKADEWAEQGERDGIDPTLATIIRMAADNVVTADVFQLAPPQRERRTQMAEMLIAMTITAPT